MPQTRLMRSAFVAIVLVATAIAVHHRIDVIAAVPFVAIVAAGYWRAGTFSRQPVLTAAGILCLSAVTVLTVVSVPSLHRFLTAPRLDSIRLEAAMAVAAILAAFVLPGFGRVTFRRIERAFGQIARRRALSVAIVGILALGIRAAMLPWLPVPVPGIDDEYSYLLAADTYAHGRLATPTHPMWQHFETIHVSQVPAYASMYPPAQGLTLAAGELLGHPWIGVWLTMAALTGAICWMAQGWLPPQWALLGGLVAILRLATFNYWENSYWGGGVAGFAGALVIGALPRLFRRPRVAMALVLGCGVAILANSRPFEGLLVSVPVGVALIGWMASSRGPAWRESAVRIVWPMVALLTVVALAMGYFNWRVFGDPLTPPYQLNRAQYAVAPHFIWQALKSSPIYRHADIRNFYLGWELDCYLAMHSAAGFFVITWHKFEMVGRFFFASVLFVPLIMLPWALRDRRTGLMTWIVAVISVGVAGEVWFEPHYVSPATAAIYVLLLQCLRHLSVWKWRGQPVGLTLVRGVVIVCLASFGARALGRAVDVGPTKARLTWDSAPTGNIDRQRIEDELKQAGGRHLVIVRYGPHHSVHEEWVQNLADIDAAPVIWAQDMDENSNQALIAYFQERKAWVIEPGSDSLVLMPYFPK